MSYYAIFDQTSRVLKSIFSEPSQVKASEGILEISGAAFNAYRTAKRNAEKAGPNQRRYIAVVEQNGTLTEATGEIRTEALKSPVPLFVTPAQLRIWLIRHGIPLAAIEATLDGIENEQVRTEARMRWEYSLEIRRDNELVGMVAAALNLSPQQIDDAFREAATF